MENFKSDDFGTMCECKECRCLNGSDNMNLTGLRCGCTGMTKCLKRCCACFTAKADCTKRCARDGCRNRSENKEEVAGRQANDEGSPSTFKVTTSISLLTGKDFSSTMVMVTTLLLLMMLGYSSKL